MIEAMKIKFISYRDTFNPDVPKVKASRCNINEKMTIDNILLMDTLQNFSSLLTATFEKDVLSTVLFPPKIKGELEEKKIIQFVPNGCVAIDAEKFRVFMESKEDAPPVLNFIKTYLERPFEESDVALLLADKKAELYQELEEMKHIFLCGEDSNEDDAWQYLKLCRALQDQRYQMIALCNVTNNNVEKEVTDVQ